MCQDAAEQLATAVREAEERKEEAVKMAEAKAERYRLCCPPDCFPFRYCFIAVSSPFHRPAHAAT